MNTHDIGRCCSCTVDPCPLPRRKKLHPEKGCSNWDNGQPSKLEKVVEHIKQHPFDPETTGPISES